ncbi:hypothetical protein AX15_000148 [Amanita polypyramis BW_CC]|nr:hypothetical protein AX15_000148 [Amanita polypyramis BW_CC]
MPVSMPRRRLLIVPTSNPTNSVCRLGYTARCPYGKLFGSPALEGGQAQYVRVPQAGSTLFNLSDANTWPNHTPTDVADSSLLMLADILPTGVFAALQCLSHPKVQTVLTSKPWPLCVLPSSSEATSNSTPLTQEDKVLNVAIIGLGPVGICTAVALLDMLATRGQPYRLVAVDLLEPRRKKMATIYSAIDKEGKGLGKLAVCSPEEAKAIVKEWTQGIGCTAVIEVVGHTSALTLAYELVRAFGVITSIGVHGDSKLPFNGGEAYSKNVSLDFGRCHARAMFPLAFELLVKRQDIFGGVGEETSLIERVTGLSEAPESYRAFDKGQVGKTVFDPWL